jgi:hypothetical protein
VQLREGGRRAWFASPDLADVVPEPDGVHSLGPLPSRRALASLAALRALAAGSDVPDVRTRAAAVGVPPPFAPDQPLFARAWDEFSARHTSAPSPARPGTRCFAPHAASRSPGVSDAGAEERPLPTPGISTASGVISIGRCCEAGSWSGRARWLVLLSDASVAFRERDAERFRLLIVEGGDIAERRDLDDPQAIPGRGAPRPWRLRQAAIDAARYDRLRVLATELARVHAEGGSVLLQIGARLITGRGAELLVRG